MTLRNFTQATLPWSPTLSTGPRKKWSSSSRPIKSLVTPPSLSLRGLAAAVALAFVGMIGNGLGARVVGVMADLLEPAVGKESLRWSLIIMSCVGFVVALTNFLAHRAILREPGERLD